jgi:hypothetical protein
MSRIVVALVLLLSCVTPFYAGEQAAGTSSEGGDTSEQEKQEDETTQKVAAKSSTHTPHLKSGKLGEHPDAVDGERRVWPHKLPIFGQKVTDLGFDLPNPYGVAALVVLLEQDVSLSDLRVKLSDGSGEPQQVPFVGIGTSDVKTFTAEAKFDFWLFPFMNLFAFVGHIDGEAFVPVVVPGEATLKAVAPALGARCDGPPGPLRPDLCDQDFIILDNTNYQGTNLGVGLTLAAGFSRWFVAVPLSYTESNLSNTNDFVHAFQGSARFGFHVPYRDNGAFTAYLGTTYLDTEQDITGTVPFDAFSIDYTIHQEAAGPWNYLAGLNWTITPKWWFQAEFGFGGTRKNLITSVTYRW